MIKSTYSLLFCTALICLLSFSVLSANEREAASRDFDFASARQSEKPENLYQPPEPNIAPPGPMLYISPRYPITLWYNYVYFYLRDADVAGYVGPNSNFMKYFDGSYYGMRNLDAVDIYVEEEFGDGGLNGECVFFSVGEDQLLSDEHNNPFYVHHEDIAVLHKDTGMFELVLEGKSKGIHGIDALSVIYYGGGGGSGANFVDHQFIFSTEHDSFIGNPPGVPDIFARHEDLVKYDPVSDTFEIFLRGHDIGVFTLDGVDVDMFDDKVYYSVKSPVSVNKYPYPPVYLKDGDVGCFDLITQSTQFYFHGKSKGVQSVDALSVYEEVPLD